MSETEDSKKYRRLEPQLQREYRRKSAIQVTNQRRLAESVDVVNGSIDQRLVGSQEQLTRSMHQLGSTLERERSSINMDRIVHESHDALLSGMTKIVSETKHLPIPAVVQSINALSAGLRFEVRFSESSVYPGPVIDCAAQQVADTYTQFLVSVAKKYPSVEKAIEHYRSKGRRLWALEWRGRVFHIENTKQRTTNDVQLSEYLLYAVQEILPMQASDAEVITLSRPCGELLPVPEPFGGFTRQVRFG